MHVFVVDPFTNYKQPPESNNTFEEMGESKAFVIGGFFGGTIFGVQWFADTFYSIHDQFLSQNYFVGKDQKIYNWISIQYPEKILVSCSCLQKWRRCGDPWFYFQRWYSTRAKNAERGECGTVPVKNMTDFLLEQKSLY